jgi:large subunit ribosomal protein L27Ae
MPTRFRKTRKFRGARGGPYCGYGRVGKHKKHESGRGNAGGMHQHRINFDKYHPGYFGKCGMRHYHKKANPLWKPTVNLSQLTKLIPNAAALKKGGDLPVVDLLQHGYAKLLGNGIIAAPCIVRARYVSKLAEKKLKAVGGAIELTA